MAYAVILIVASFLSTGCMFEAERAFGCNNVGVFGCKDRVPPSISHEPSPHDAETRTSVLKSNRDERKCSAVSKNRQGPAGSTPDQHGESGGHYPDTPSFVLLIDACLSKGGSREKCIESLPSEELAKLEAEEARRGTIRRRQMQWRQEYSENIMVFGFAAVELPAGWRSRVEKPNAPGRQSVFEYFQPDGAGVLKMKALLTSVPVTQAQLRNLTNVDPEIQLAYSNWGDFTGYHFEQIENNIYYRHWWLAEGSNIILITYQCEPDMRGAERAQVDGIINSLRKHAKPDSGNPGHPSGAGFE